MSSTNFTQKAAQVADELEKAGVEPDIEAIEGDIRDAVETFNLPVEQAVRTVANNRAPSDSDVSPMGGGNTEADLADVGSLHDDASGEAAWLTVTGQVMGTWDIDHDSVAQKAELADETGRTEVTVWDSANAPELSEGDIVELENVPTDLYQGNYSVKVTSQSSIEFIDEDIDPVENLHEVAGRVVTVRDGLIERCSAEGCSRTLSEGACSEHGDVEGEYDLRLQLTLDDGEGVDSLTLHRDEVESLFDTTLEEQIQVATDALDEDVPGQRMTDELLGHRVVAEGPELYDSIHADEVMVVSGTSEEEVMDSLVEAREARSAAVGQ